MRYIKQVVFPQTEEWHLINVELRTRAVQEGEGKWEILRFPSSTWFRGKESACQAGDASSIPGSGRTPQEGDDNPLLYSCLGNPMDRAWQATIHGVTRMIDMI